MPKLELTSQERSALRARAHPLRPVVLLGDKGLTDAVIKEIDRNLTAHQLIKVKAAGEDRDSRQEMLDTLCETLSCAPIHHLGKTLILYRPSESELAAQASELQTRALRKASEPHTPKKLAASGITRTRRGEIAKRAARKTERLEEAAPQARRTATLGGIQKPGTRKVAGTHGIPKRSGSALSLKAGARRRLGTRSR
ncbi:MAG: hypothetical protein CML16_07575 [Pusillimonas sp.]|nr:hypothetical protein [Pusillimonas sp.]MBC43389.1 hypothetical protein [Pusillimonas sp.]HCP79453.1 hypothetical protein [Pusillimonas sp.]|tara:strand:+ start:18657 stop:19247 length:591 start_codon:yes stop_codon:yes gene_type:complete